MQLAIPESASVPAPGDRHRMRVPAVRVRRAAGRRAGDVRRRRVVLQPERRRRRPTLPALSCARAARDRSRSRCPARSRSPTCSRPMPEVASAPLHVIVTGCEYQPFASGRPAGSPSVDLRRRRVVLQPKRRARGVPGVVLQLPGSRGGGAVRPGVARRRAARDPRGRVAPLQVRPTEWLYQPFASGARAGAAPTPVGGSASILIAPRRRGRAVVVGRGARLGHAGRRARDRDRRVAARWSWSAAGWPSRSSGGSRCSRACCPSTSRCSRRCRRPTTRSTACRRPPSRAPRLRRARRRRARRPVSARLASSYPGGTMKRALPIRS